MSKKVVYYTGDVGLLGVGHGAYLKPINHPNVSNEKVVRTSKVVAFDEASGVIETENTIYRRKQ
jgi:hypothetical protein